MSFVSYIILSTSAIRVWLTIQTEANVVCAVVITTHTKGAIYVLDYNWWILQSTVSRSMDYGSLMPQISDECQVA